MKYAFHCQLLSPNVPLKPVATWSVVVLLLKMRLPLPIVRVLKRPFRDAHHIAGSIVKRSEELGVLLDRLPLEEMQIIEPAIGKEVYDVLSLEASLKSRASFGGTAPDRVREQIAFWRERFG